MINFFRNMWKKCSGLLAPLTFLTSKNFKYDWKDKHQKCFDAIKHVIGRGAHKFDYLGNHVTRDSVMTIPNKFKAIQALTAPKTRKQLRQFIGMINFYRDMWKKTVRLGQQYFTSYHTFDSIKTISVLVFPVVCDVFGGQSS